MTWRRDKRPELVRAMSGRLRHEALRGHVAELLREGFGAPYDEIAHELYLLDNRGRIDTMWGATVIELKSDFRRELPDVQARMPDYLADAARRTHIPRPVTGIATDGATFIGYQLVEGALTELRRYETDPERPNELMAWLEPLLSEQVGLAPEARAVAQAFGKGSLTFSRARFTPRRLTVVWAGHPTPPSCKAMRVRSISTPGRVLSRRLDRSKQSSCGRSRWERALRRFGCSRPSRR